MLILNVMLKELSSVRGDNTSCTGKNQKHIPCSFAYNVVCLDDKFSKPNGLYRVKYEVYRMIEAILIEYDY